MREIGVRELKASLSGVLHEVEDGEQIKVTVRGRHVADLVPAGVRRSDRQLRELVADGKVTLAAAPHPSRVRRPLRTGRSASEIVLAEREEER
jgi:prevent-host-death family protein